MYTPETSHNGYEVNQIKIPLPAPEELDDAWCGMVNQAYGFGTNTRTLLPAVTFVMDARPPRKRDSGMPDYRRWRLPDDIPEEEALIDGELVAVRRVPIPIVEGDDIVDFDYSLHLAVRDVEEVSSGWRLPSPDDVIWLPLDPNDEELLLY